MRTGQGPSLPEKPLVPSQAIATFPCGLRRDSKRAKPYEALTDAISPVMESIGKLGD
jgi:hypothetical protein